MKLVSFRIDAVDRWGIAEGDCIVDLTTPECKTVREALARFPTGELRALGARATRYIPLEQVEFLTPMPNPDKILCVGINYLCMSIDQGGRTT